MHIDWAKVERVLLVRLRSIGDTVLATPSLIALKSFLPNAQVDILLEDWVVPVLDGFDAVDNVITAGKSGANRFRTSWHIRKAKYDVVFNLHGGTTGTFFTFASGAKHRIGYSHYQYRFLYDHVVSASSDFWQRTPTHSAEQQLAMLGFAGVPVEDRPKSRLAVTERAARSLEAKFLASARASLSDIGEFALIHPAAAFESKQWPTERFAAAAGFLAEKGLKTIAVASPNERAVLDKLVSTARVPVVAFDDLTLPEITALAAQARVFIGNDSGIAHIAAAVNTPAVVIFGSSNIDHWRPWTDAPNEVVRQTSPCADLAGHNCLSSDLKCIRGIGTDAVTTAIDRVLQAK